MDEPYGASLNRHHMAIVLYIWQVPNVSAALLGSSIQYEALGNIYEDKNLHGPLSEYS